jgi:Uma2 family endonuclease
MIVSLSPLLGVVTAADLIRHLGDIPAERIWLNPRPGTATEEDVIAAENSENRLCELVDGVLVEKTMGLYESRLAVVVGTFLDEYTFVHDLGIVYGADGTLKFMPGLVRIPDVSFVSWSRLPERKLPTEPIPHLIPDLTVEVLSAGNTRREMERKLHEYFTTGVRQVWLVDGKKREFRVFTSEKRSRVYGEGDTVPGGKLLPGFSLAVTEFFNRAEHKR